MIFRQLGIGYLQGIRYLITQKQFSKQLIINGLKIYGVSVELQVIRYLSSVHLIQCLIRIATVYQHNSYS